jgi:hypothetical protein
MWLDSCLSPLSVVEAAVGEYLPALPELQGLQGQDAHPGVLHGVLVGGSKEWQPPKQREREKEKL